MRVLVTGADGFVGPHLTRALASARHEVITCGGPDAAEHSLDIRDPVAVSALVRDSRPDSVAHLAGWSSVGTSFDKPLDCFAVNALGTAHLFEAIRTEAPRARVLLVSSGEVYGKGQGVCCRVEGDLVAPASPYATSKHVSELIAHQYHTLFGIQALVARPFNHLGPGQDARFVVPSLARQVFDIKRGLAEPVIRVGNLDAVRDFSSVLDVVDAYVRLLTAGAAGEVYNVCSGRGRSIREVLDEIIERAGVHAEVRVDPARFRPVEIPHLVGAPDKLIRLGWSARRDPLAWLFAEASSRSPS
jgi:GDP-4-dehydro-6-deoxy-D-mannose reductase